MAKKEPLELADLPEAKKWLRRALIRLRQSLPEKKRRQASRRILSTLVQTASYKKAKTVATFLGFGSEVQTRALVEHAWKAGKRVLIPITTHGFSRPYFAVFRKGDELHKTHRGPLELRKAPPANFKDIDLVIVPGLGFDRRGVRLGYGGGVYDRMLQKIPRAEHVGLFFSQQYMPILPADRFDQKLDLIITEKGAVRPV